MSCANHHDWVILIAMASNARSEMTGVVEGQLWSRLRREAFVYFGHVPDYMTFFINGTGRHIAVWHEVEASRRSRSVSVESKRRAKKEGRVARSGMEHFQDLLQKPRLKRFVTYEDKEHTAVFVIHCATEKIERELRVVIEHTVAISGVRADEYGYVVSFTSARYGDLFIFIHRLPSSLNEVWLGTGGFPWPNAPSEISVHSSHRYLAKE